MCTGKDIHGVKSELEAILNKNSHLSEACCQKLLTCILEMIEKRDQEIFMEGYRYAISLLEDGVVKKQ